MNSITTAKNYTRLTTATATFRIYDTGLNGYAVMLNGKVIGYADNEPLAIRLAMANRPKFGAV